MDFDISNMVIDMAMNFLWNYTEKIEPPEEKILLVSGPLGIDLAMRLDGQWYFKAGDSWELSSLEFWGNYTPTQWVEFDFPGVQAVKDREEVLLEKIA